MLLDPAEQEFDLPAHFVEAGNLDGGAGQIVGEKGEDGTIVALHPYATHRDRKLGITLACEPHLSIIDDRKPIGLALLEWSPENHRIEHVVHIAGDKRDDRRHGMDITGLSAV